MTVDLTIDETLSENQILWRYMDLSKFIFMLEKKSLWLTRADKFRDRHEGRFPKEMKQLIEKAYESFEVDESSVKNASDFQDYLLKNTFINCWHKNSDENMVMWEIYGKINNAVAIQTTVKNIRNSIDVKNLTGHSLLLKNVIYKEEDEMSGAMLYEECFFRKRPHFSFEQEVRISLDTYSSLSPSKQTPDGHILTVDINSLIEKILVHPDSGDWFVSVVDSIKEKYAVKAQVFRGLYGVN